MKIVVIGGYAKSLTNFRGPLLAELVAAGHEVTACAPEADENVVADLARIGVRYFPIPIERTGMNPFRDLLSLLRITRFLQSMKPDLVMSYTIKPVIFGSLAAKCAGVPLICSMITGLGYAFIEGGFKRRFVNFLVTHMYCLALHFNRTVFFQNPDDLGLFTESGIVDEGKACLINGSGVDLEYYSIAALGREPVFLMIARLLRDKGAVVYVEAARTLKRRYPRAVFQLLGPLDTNPTAISRSELDTWQQEGVIEYLGSTKDVRPYIQHATVYVLPSYYREGTPRTVLEAMSMGRAVVTTDAPGCRETVVDGDNGFLVPIKDSGALALAMERFIQYPELIEKMGGRSREIAEVKYDVRKVNAAIMQKLGL